MEFRLDRDLPIPLGTQLRGLIEYGIGCGELLPGERLPSVREMADVLGVAPMTVAQVYRDLRDRGLIQGRSGDGTYVADVGKPGRHKARDMAALHHGIDALVDQGVAMGMRSSELASLIVARMAERQARGRTRHIVVVGNFQQATAAYARSVAEIVGPGATVAALTIDAIARDPAAHGRAAAADIVLTLPHRRRELESLLPGSVVAAISFIPAQATRRALASLDPSARLVVVSIFPEFAPLMKAAVQRFAPHVPAMRVVLMDDPALDAVLAQADVLVFATGADHIVPRLAPGTPAFEYRHTPEPADVRRVVEPLLAPDSLRPPTLARPR